MWLFVNTNSAGLVEAGPNLCKPSTVSHGSLWLNESGDGVDPRRRQSRRERGMLRSVERHIDDPGRPQQATQDA